MTVDLKPDELTQVRRVMRFLEDGAPLPPDLPQGSHRALRPQPRHPYAVALAAFVVVLAVTVPLALSLRGGDGPDVTTTGAADDTAADPVAGEVPDPVVERAALPGLTEPRRLALPVAGTEPLLLAVGDNAVFAAASLSNPQVWDERVWRSVDGGARWSQVLGVRGEGTLVDLAGEGDAVTALISGHVVDGPPVLYRSSDGGTTWQRTFLPVPDGLDPVNVAATSVVTDGERVLVAGYTWQRSSEGPDDNFYRSWVWAADGGSWRVVEVTAQGHIQNLTWSGAVFVAVGRSLHPTEPHDNALPAIWTSVDGLQWTTTAVQPQPGIRTSDGFTSVAIGPDGRIMALTVAQEWSVVVVAEDDVERATEAEARALAESGGAFREATTSGTFIAYSADGADWHHTYLHGMAIGAAVGTPWGFVAAAVPVNPPYDYRLVTSVDGATWTDRRAIDAHVTGGVADTDGIFLSGFGETATGSQQAVIWRVDWR